MIKRNFVWGILAVLIGIALSDHAQAQRPAYYYPARPTFSPYLFYGQFNGTGLPNYYTQIRPASRYYQEYLSRSRVSQQGGFRQTMSGERQVLSRIENQLSQRPTTGIGQPAVPAQFLDTSHFYPRSPQRRR